jgi:hypothetical protein
MPFHSPIAGETSRTSQVSMSAIPHTASESPSAMPLRSIAIRYIRLYDASREIAEYALHIYLIARFASVSMVGCRCQDKNGHLPHMNGEKRLFAVDATSLAILLPASDGRIMVMLAMRTLHLQGSLDLS